MVKPNGFDEAQAITGEFEALPAGGYVCKIIRAELTVSQRGAEMLRIAIDISGGEYDGYFRKMFDRRRINNPDAKWPCQYYQLTQGDHVGRLKGMLQNIEASNDGWKWNWDESELAGKLCGGRFQEEEYRGSDGKVHTSTRCSNILPVAGIDEIAIPEKKTLNGQSEPSYSSPMNSEEIPF